MTRREREVHDGHALLDTLDRGADRARGVSLPRQCEGGQKGHEPTADRAAELLDEDMVSVGEIAATSSAVMPRQGSDAPLPRTTPPLLANGVRPLAECLVVLLDFPRIQRQDERQ